MSASAVKSPAGLASALPGDQCHLISRAISDPTRFKILQQIAASRHIACTEIREHFNVTAPTISHHLKELEAAGLIDTERAGKELNLTFRRDIWQAYLSDLGQI